MADATRPFVPASLPGEPSDAELRLALRRAHERQISIIEALGRRPTGHELFRLSALALIEDRDAQKEGARG